MHCEDLALEAGEDVDVFLLVRSLSDIKLANDLIELLDCDNGFKGEELQAHMVCLSCIVPVHIRDSIVQAIEGEFIFELIFEEVLLYLVAHYALSVDLLGPSK